MASTLAGFCRGHVKTLVNAAPVDHEEALLHRSVDACQTTRNYPGISEWMRRSMMRRVDSRTENHGGHFEQYSFSYNSQIKCFWTHVHTAIFFLFWCLKVVPEVG
jgi:hypothetical protein